MTQHVRRKQRRIPKETATLRADRERYQREKPPPQQLLAEGGHKEFVPLGELLVIHQLMDALMKERQRQGLTLAALSQRSGIDQAAISKLENGSNANPTLSTLYRIALALGKVITCALHDVPDNTSRRQRLTRAQ